MTYHSPPKRIRYTLKVGVLLRDLGKIDGRTEQDNTDDQEENKEEEFSYRRAQCLAQNLQALGMTTQLQYSKHPDQADNSQDCQRRRLIR